MKRERGGRDNFFFFPCSYRTCARTWTGLGRREGVIITLRTNHDENETLRKQQRRVGSIAPSSSPRHIAAHTPHASTRPSSALAPAHPFASLSLSHSPLSSNTMLSAVSSVSSARARFPAVARTFRSARARQVALHTRASSAEQARARPRAPPPSSRASFPFRSRVAWRRARYDDASPEDARRDAPRSLFFFPASAAYVYVYALGLADAVSSPFPASSSSASSSSSSSSSQQKSEQKVQEQQQPQQKPPQQTPRYSREYARNPYARFSMSPDPWNELAQLMGASTGLAFFLKFGFTSSVARRPSTTHAASTDRSRTRLHRTQR
jgi:hypothetical protein